MALDPSIILQAGKGVTPLLSPAEIQDQQMQRELGTMQLQKARQAMSDDNALRQAYSAGGDIGQTLQQKGLYKPAMEYQKFQTEQLKTQREAQKAKLEAGIKQFEAIGQIMSGVKDQPSYDAARQQVAQIVGPEAMANIPASYDPALIARNQQQAMSVKEQMVQKWKEMEYTTPNANSLLSAETSRANNAATIANSRENAQLVDARAREANRLRAEANQSGRVPSGYRQAADGSLEFIPGGPADPTSKAGGGKPLTEGQSKALLFGTRMQEANSIFDELAQNGVTTSVPGSRAGYGVGAAINALQPADRQRLDQAKRDFLNAVLRRESGAVIADSEFNNGDKQYFPQPGDGAEVIAQKKRNREVAMRGILAEVPDGDSRVAQVRGSTAPASKPGTPLKRGASQAASADLGGIEAELKRRGLLK